MPSDPIDDELEQSFPASDPPDWTGMHAGAPRVDGRDTRPASIGSRSTDRRAGGLRGWATALRDGAALVTASGDKLLGGPQAGLLLGRADLVRVLTRHPLARALRVDKLTLAALEATLTGPVPPVAAALAADPASLFDRAERIVVRVTETGLDAQVVPALAAVGGGGAPGVELPSAALSLPSGFALPLRRGALPVVGRLEGGRLLLDLRSVPPEQDELLVRALLAAASG